MLTSAFLGAVNNNSVEYLPLRYDQILGFIIFRVPEEDNGQLKVITNEETCAPGWIASELEEVEAWGEFLSSMHHISGIDRRISKSPTAQSGYEHGSDYDCLN